MSDPMVHPIPHPIPHGFRDRREVEKGEVERGEGVDPSTTSLHCPTSVSSTPLHNRAREFENWLVYEDEKEAIREEAVLLQKRLHQLRRRWQSIVAAQAEEQEAA